jgi:hypothetical protein
MTRNLNEKLKSARLTFSTYVTFTYDFIFIKIFIITIICYGNCTSMLLSMLLRIEKNIILQRWIELIFCTLLEDFSSEIYFSSKYIYFQNLPECIIVVHLKNE